MKEKLKAFIKKGQWLRSAIFTILLIVLILAIYIGINALVDKIDPMDIDFTSEKLYSLSQESKDKIASVKKDTKIILYGMSDYPEVEDFAKLYSKQNEHITYEVLTDAGTRPDLQTNYGIGSSTTSLIIMEAGERRKAVTVSDLYSVDYTTYESIDKTEQSLTNAILAVNLESTPKIYFATDHAYYKGEYTAAEECLKNEGNDIEDLTILTNGGIPEDCDVLIITTLTEDFTEFEKNEILAYIHKGGKLMILADPNFGLIELPNFESILDEYGVSISDGEVFETDSASMINGYADMIIPNINSESEITRYISTDGALVFMGSGKINFVSDEELENLGVTKENLIYSKDTAFIRTDYTTTSTSRIESDEDAAGVVLGSLLTKKITNEDGTETTSQLLLYSNSIMVSDLAVTLNGTTSNSTSQVMGIQFYNNKDLMINSVSYLTQRTDNVTLRKDSGTTYTFTATEQEVLIIKTIIIALPIVILVAGIIVWQIRRRKK